MVNKSKMKKEKRKKDWFLFLILGLGIVILALFLRIYNIFSIPIFADEAIYIRWAQVMRSESTLRFLPLSDGKQPLFMWVTIPFLKVFADPLVAGRMVSIFSGLATIMGIFLLTHKLSHSKYIALVASFFYAISPFSVFFDRMALVDSMLSMFGVWSLYFAVLTAQKLRLDTAMLAGFALGGGWLTKSPGLFFLLMLPATGLLVSWEKGLKEKLIHAVKLFSLWLVSWGISIALYNILRLGPNFHMIGIRNKDYVFSFQEALRHPLDPLQFHTAEIIDWFWRLLPGTVLIVAIIGILVSLKTYWRAAFLLLVWALFPLLVQAEFAKVFTARYILFTLPPIFVLAGMAFLPVFKRFSKRVIALFLIIIAVPALWFDYLLLTSPDKASLPPNERSGYLEVWTAGTGIREAASYIKNQKLNIKDGEEGIVVGTEGFFGTLPDGLQIYIEDIPGVTVIGVGITLSDVHKSLIDAKKAGNSVYLIVNSTRFEGDADKLGLKLINSYGKALRPDGSYESLLFFEVTENAIPQQITTTNKTS